MADQENKNQNVKLDWAVVGLLALLVGLFFWRILTPDLTDRASFPTGDFARQFWAFATFEARELAAGRLPLWNPYTYGGAPFWADIQSAVLYPPSLVTLILSGAGEISLFALELEAIVHFWLAGMFTYLLVRRLTGHRGGALLAAIIFTFGGYLTSYPSQQLAVLETDVWLPLILYCADRALVDRSGEKARLHPAGGVNWAYLLLAGLAWGMALLAGHPQSAMLVFYAFTAYVAFISLAYRRRGINESANERVSESASQREGESPSQRVSESTNAIASASTETSHRSFAHSLIRSFAYSLTRPFVHWLVIVGIGLGLSAVAWLPALEYMRLSVRAAGFYDEMSGGFPLYDSIQMLLPGAVSPYSPLYVGVLPLLLAIWAALTLRRRETIFWGGMAAVAFLLSFGGESFLYTPFYLLVPGFSIFRGQERAAFLFSFALAVLAGYGFKYQMANAKWQMSKLRRVVGWLLVGSLGAVVLFFYGLNSTGWQEDSPFHFLLSRSVWLALMLAMAWGLIRASEGGPRGNGRLRGRFYVPLIGLGTMLLVTLDLFTINWKTNVYPALPETQTVPPAVVQAIYDDVTQGQAFRVYNEYRVYENYGVPFSLVDAWGASPLRLAGYDDLYRSLRMERVWQLLNVKYVITWREELYAPSQIIYQEPTDHDVTYVHRLDEIAPRAWLVYHAEEIGDDDALARLDAFEFDPARVALVPPGTRLVLQQPPGDRPDEGSFREGSVAVTGRTPGSVSLSIDAPADGLLVLSEIHYPGWRAMVDGSAVPVIRTDHILRGIPVPAGKHQVQLVFRPVTFTVGAALSGITLGALAVAGVWVWLRKRPRT